MTRAPVARYDQRLADAVQDWTGSDLIEIGPGRCSVVVVGYLDGPIDYDMPDGSMWTHDVDPPAGDLPLVAIGDGCAFVLHNSMTQTAHGIDEIDDESAPAFALGDALEIQWDHAVSPGYAAGELVWCKHPDDHGGEQFALSLDPFTTTLYLMDGAAMIRSPEIAHPDEWE